MKIRTLWIACVAIILLSCKPHYQLTEMSGTIVEMNATYDLPTHERMQ